MGPVFVTSVKSGIFYLSQEKSLNLAGFAVIEPFRR